MTDLTVPVSILVYVQVFMSFSANFHSNHDDHLRTKHAYTFIFSEALCSTQLPPPLVSKNAIFTVHEQEILVHLIAMQPVLSSFIVCFILHKHIEYTGVCGGRYSDMFIHT